MKKIYWCASNLILVKHLLTELQGRGCQIVHVATAADARRKAEQFASNPAPIVVNLEDIETDTTGTFNRGLLRDLKTIAGDDCPIFVLSTGMTPGLHDLITGKFELPFSHVFTLPLVRRRLRFIEVLNSEARQLGEGRI